MGKAAMLRFSAKVDCAIRALVALARVAPEPMKGDPLARQENIPFRFLELTLGELRHAGLVGSRRGTDGGYWLAAPAASITLEQVVIAIEGGLIDVRAVRATDGSGAPASLRGDDLAGNVGDTREQLLAVWARAEDRLRDVLRSVTLADLARGQLAPSTAD